MKTADIEVANSHFFGFPTQATVVRENEIQTLVANLIEAGQWFEVAPFPPDRWSLRVKMEHQPFVALIREQLQ